MFFTTPKGTSKETSDLGVKGIDWAWSRDIPDSLSTYLKIPVSDEIMTRQSPVVRSAQITFAFIILIKEV
jgi:hypothetical protein